MKNEETTKNSKMYNINNKSNSRINSHNNNHNSKTHESLISKKEGNYNSTKNKILDSYNSNEDSKFYEKKYEISSKGKRKRKNNKSKKNYPHIERIIIDLVRKEDKTHKYRTDSYVSEKENSKNNNINYKNLRNIDNNIQVSDTFKSNSNNSPLNIVKNRWIEKCLKCNELDFKYLANENENIKQEIKNSKENILNGENNNFLYSEKAYIKDLTNLVKDITNNSFFAISYKKNDNLNELNFKRMQSKTKENFESELHNLYLENKMNDENIDKNISKIFPIYLLNETHIKKLYEDTNNLDKKTNKTSNSKLSIEKQIFIEYEVIDVFTPKNTDNIKLEPFPQKINSGIDETKKDNKTNDFSQNTTIDLLFDKFYIFAVSRNAKYSIPEKQININFICFSPNNSKIDISKTDIRYNTNINFSNKEKNNDKTNNIIDISNYSEKRIKYN